MIALVAMLLSVFGSDISVRGGDAAKGSELTWEDGDRGRVAGEFRDVGPPTT